MLQFGTIGACFYFFIFILVLEYSPHLMPNHKTPNVQADFIGRSEDKYQILLTELEPHLQVQYNKRCEEAVKEGDELT